MKARMKDNLIMRYQQSPELKGELHAVLEVHGWAEYVKTKVFLKSIEGKTVDLIFTAGDAFEKNDNNIWLPPSLWDKEEI